MCILEVSTLLYINPLVFSSKTYASFIVVQVLWDVSISL